MGGKGSGPKSKGITEVLRAHVKESHRLRENIRKPLTKH